MAATETVHGVIIRTFPSGEADLVLRIITAEHGKISAIAKHARKSSKRFSSSLDMLDRGKFEIKDGRGSLTSVASYTSQGSFKNIRDNLCKLTCASVLCESADFLIPERSGPTDSTYETLCIYFGGINESLQVKETLKLCFEGTLSLLVKSGFVDTQEFTTPSAKNLIKLLNQIENTSERELLSKGEILNLLKSLKD